MRETLATIAILLLIGSPSLACLNDSDLIKSENEFKSTYLHPSEQEGRKEFPFGIAAVAIGLAGMIGAAFILPRASQR